MSEWNFVRIGDVCKTTSGGTPLKSKKEYYEGGTIPWLNSGEVRQLEITCSRHFITPLGLKNSSAKLFPPETVLFALYGATAGQVGVLKFEAATNQAICGILPSEQLDSKFLCFCLRSQYEKIVAQAVGNAQPNLSQQKVRDLEVPLLSLSEQKRIVAILDEAFGAIARAKENAARNLANARELFDSYLNRVFTEKGEGWEETTLGKVAEFKNGLNYDKNSKGQTLPVVGVGDFQKNFYVPLDSLETATIDEELADNYALEKNDILTVRSNGSKHLIGRCMLVPELQEVTSYSGFVIRIRFDQTKLNPRFLLYFMKSGRTVYLLTRDGGGANINNINQGKLSKLPLSFPTDRDEQVRLANVLDQVSKEADSLTACYQQKLTALDELKQSLLQKAFTGQLTGKASELELVK